MSTADTLAEVRAVFRELDARSPHLGCTCSLDRDMRPTPKSEPCRLRELLGIAPRCVRLSRETKYEVRGGGDDAKRESRGRL